MSRTTPVGSYGLGTNFPNRLAAPSNSGVPEQMSTGINGCLARTRSASASPSRVPGVLMSVNTRSIGSPDSMNSIAGRTQPRLPESRHVEASRQCLCGRKAHLRRARLGTAPYRVLAREPSSHRGSPYRTVNGVPGPIVPGQPVFRIILAGFVPKDNRPKRWSRLVAQNGKRCDNLDQILVIG